MLGKSGHYEPKTVLKLQGIVQGIRVRRKIVTRKARKSVRRSWKQAQPVRIASEACFGMRLLCLEHTNLHVRHTRNAGQAARRDWRPGVGTTSGNGANIAGK